MKANFEVYILQKQKKKFNFGPKPMNVHFANALNLRVSKCFDS